jgi:hypothetical protein
MYNVLQIKKQKKEEDMNGKLNDLNELPAERKLFEGHRYIMSVIYQYYIAFDY